MKSIADLGYVVVTDHIEANTGADVSDAIQKIIDENPHRTIFFPDGEYILAKPICTSANGANAVSLELSKFATLKASDDWSSDEAMVRLGAAEPFNSIRVNGSNYGIFGGIIDGSGVANGISIDSGRETVIEKVSIKNTFIGIHIKHGANGNSSDADVQNVNIVGNSKKGSIGVLIEGSDNSFTNMRIAAVQFGFKILASSQLLKNIHPLYTFGGDLADDEVYKESCAFWDDTWTHGIYNCCYSDQFAVGFRMRDGARQIYTDCICYWYSGRGGKAVGFHCDGRFNSVLRSCNVFDRHECSFKAYLTVTQEGGQGVISHPLVVPELLTDHTYKNYVIDKDMTNL
ncbi:MAG: hypothetical protein E7642_03950 [Ruminococcaceae bacterium]|nr:hypothetical protein [Oscillospiraceae bacterium]